MLSPQVYRGVARQSEDGSPALSPSPIYSRLEEPLLKRSALKAKRSSRFTALLLKRAFYTDELIRNDEILLTFKLLVIIVYLTTLGGLL